MFTDPPLPYIVCKGRIVTVRNPACGQEMQGLRTVAGMPLELWDEPAKHQSLLPKSFRGIGCVIGYFYQVHHESVGHLEQLERHFEDATGRTPAPAVNPRRRVVIFVQLPSTLGGDVRRFARRRSSGAMEMPTESVTVIDAANGAEQDNTPIYEWWLGPAPPQHLVQSPPEGRWKPYHPQVCRRLEAAYQNNHSFRSGEAPTDVDGVRYMMQHVIAERPFDYFGAPSREPFLAENKVTVDHPCFSAMDRASQNCFMQFQKGNPQRRRPARRRPDASEIAKRAVMTGHPCSICFSEDGQLTGCNNAHVICKQCLCMGLRTICGDTLVWDNLLCGCFSKTTRKALLTLAEHADVSVQDRITSPPKDELERQDFESEMQLMRRQFDLGAGDIPSNVFFEKMREWFKKVFIHDVGHLYHACQHPSCANKMENWILKDQFESEYQARGCTTWVCPEGHRNSVLPSAEEIDDMNRNLLLHPEYYIESAYYSQCPLRRYRLCQDCLVGGVLMLAMHGGECKQWPGYGRGHHHVFCFACARPWGDTSTSARCSHTATDCRDPGIQQVRRRDNELEVGYVDGKQYINWLKGYASAAPPTRFLRGEEPGMQRQRRLGLTDTKELLAESRKGTS
uniref:Uncharacterized protein n=1 Tax=Zooxanthella nutricula TaxID=1333877 RepID=A0A7S2Q919_9DINO